MLAFLEVCIYIPSRPLLFFLKCRGHCRVPLRRTFKIFMADLRTTLTSNANVANRQTCYTDLLRQRQLYTYRCSRWAHWRPNPLMHLQTLNPEKQFVYWHFKKAGIDLFPSTFSVLVIAEKKWFCCQSNSDLVLGWSMTPPTKPNRSDFCFLIIGDVVSQVL